MLVRHELTPLDEASTIDRAIVLAREMRAGSIAGFAMRDIVTPDEAEEITWAIIDDSGLDRVKQKTFVAERMSSLQRRAAVLLGDTAVPDHILHSDAMQSGPYKLHVNYTEHGEGRADFFETVAFELGSLSYWQARAYDRGLLDNGLFNPSGKTVSLHAGRLLAFRAGGRPVAHIFSNTSQQRRFSLTTAEASLGGLC
jgi:hypothetical protein